MKPPNKPSDIVAEAYISSIHRNTGDEEFRTYVWVGHPYKEGEQWICEEFVQGFFQRKAPGSSSLEALANALCLVRIDLEGLVALGHKLFIPGEVEGDNSEVLKRVFGLYSALELNYRAELVQPSAGSADSIST